MKKSITLKELSKILGVSISTISKALNDSPEISHDTKTKVKELAALHKYQPNVLARNLKSGTTKTIAVVIPSVQNFFFAQVLYGIEQEIAKTDYNLVVSLTNESLEKESNNLNHFSNGIVDGFIVTASEETQIKKEYTHFKSALDNKKAIVMFDRVIKDINCDKVLVDDKEAVYKATSHLIKSGRKKIALVSTISNLTVGKSRIAGYKQALNENGIEFLESYVVSSSEEGIKKETDLFLSNNQTDAIIALDIQSSLSSLKSVKEKGLEIPKDVAIIGYSSERTASHLTPELSTISQNGIEIGRKATKLLIDRLKFPEKPFENIVVASKIQNRQSS